MRVTRSLMVLSALLLTIATGCAPPQPVAYMPVPAPATLDSMAYGAPGQAYAPNYAYVQRYAYPQTSGYAATYGYPASYARAPGYAYTPTPATPAAATPAGASPSSGLYMFAAGTPRSVSTPVASANPMAQSYTLDAGDRLRVVVFGQDGLTNSYAVDASGHIAMPLIGTVMARDETTDQLAASIAAKLRDGFVREPHVAVEIEAYRPFFVLGEVTQPGQYPYVANMTAETAVAIAGGFTPRAYHTDVVLSRTAGGETFRATVPVTTPVRPGDTITINERWF